MWERPTYRDPRTLGVRTSALAGMTDLLNGLYVDDDGTLFLTVNAMLFRESSVPIALPYGTRIRAAAFDTPDGFLVGDGGLVAHIAIEGVVPELVCPL